MSTSTGRPPSTGAPPKLRVLALHSFRTSGAIFKQQFERGKMMERLDDLVDLVFMDAPNPASGAIPRDVEPFFAAPYYEWFTVETMGDKLEYDVAKIDRSLALVERALREQGPFDGLIGFSQGTAMASSVMALQRAGLALQDIPPIKFCVLFAGFKSRYPPHEAAWVLGGRSRYPPHEAAWVNKVRAPSLHIYGDRDGLRLKCKDLADAFENAVVLQHGRGHSIPILDPVQMAVMRAFIASFLPQSVTHTPPPPQQQQQQQQQQGGIQRRATSSSTMEPTVAALDTLDGAPVSSLGRGAGGTEEEKEGRFNLGNLQSCL